MRASIAVCLVLLLAACASTPPAAKVDPAAAEQAVKQRVVLLLDRYSRNDQVGVVAMLDPERFTLLGTGFDERVNSPSELRSLMDRDFGQWGAASYSDLRDLDVRTDGTLATAVFVMTWHAGSGPTIPVRLCTTWHKINGEWMLTQSASAIPPQG